jgi:hypothetical protein
MPQSRAVLRNRGQTARDVFYHPQACNCTSPLQSRRVLTRQGGCVWLEGLIVDEQLVPLGRALFYRQARR